MKEATITIESHNRHPSDLRRWDRSRTLAVQRGRAVCELLTNEVCFSEAVVLDAGCGYGGTSIALNECGADVIAVDRDLTRLQALETLCPSIETEQADLTDLPYPNDSFDLIVFQDVIEHVAAPTEVLGELHRVLRDDGILYMSTPNRNSFFNFFSDPHFGLPFASVKNREQLRPILRKYRPSEADRDDLAQLLTLDNLTTLLKNAGLTYRFINSRAARTLFDQPEAMVWSNWHLRAIAFLRHTGLQSAALWVVNDKQGFFNRWLNPTWYLICRKSQA